VEKPALSIIIEYIYKLQYLLKGHKCTVMAEIAVPLPNCLQLST